MDVYIDQNLIIDCLNENGWRDNAVQASRTGRVRFVLSPWSIYEIGNASQMEELLDLVEDLAPFWILERVDLQLREFVVAWNNFWNGTTIQFDPIGTLPEIQASFLRCSVESTQVFSVRDFARIWRRNDATRETGMQFKRMESINSFNRMTYGDRKLTPEAIRELRKRFVARQFVNARGMGMPPEEIHERENLILRERSLESLISRFVDSGGMSTMLSHRIEESMTFDQWKSAARLNPNRQIDRIHAIAALPYCNLFVTSDRELIRKTQAIRGGLGFNIAEVITGEEFMERLKVGSL